MKGPRALACWRWLPVLPLLFGAACGGPQALGDAGAKCFRDDDCSPGLICVAPPMDGVNRVCSSDPTPLISNVARPPLAMGGDAAMAGSAGAAVAGGGMAPVAGGGAGGTATGGTDTGGTAMAGTDTGGTATAGTDTGGTDAGGSAGSNAGTDTGGTGGTMAGTGGTAPEGGAP